MTQTETPDAEIDLKQYIELVMRRRRVVAAVFVMVFTSVALYVFSMRPVYEGSALLVIEKEQGGGGMVADNGEVVQLTDDDYYQTQYHLLKSQSLLQEVYNKMGLAGIGDFAQPGGVNKLSRAITITPVIRSRLVYVKADSHDPKLAADIANTLAQTFVEQNLENQLFISQEVLHTLQVKGSDAQIEQAYASLPEVVKNQLIQTLQSQYAELQSKYADLSAKYTPAHPAMVAIRGSMVALKEQIQAQTDRIVQSLKTQLSGQLQGNNVRIVDSADVPKGPIKPQKVRSLLIGAFLGLAFGLGVAFLVEALDPSLWSEEDVERKLGLPFLGMVPFAPQKQEVPVYQPLLGDAPSLSGEAMRNLRTMVDFAAVGQKNKVFLVTSSVQSEGKSFAAVNLAVAFAQAGESVLIIDGDLRRPSLHKKLFVASDKGLSDFLLRGQKPEEIEDYFQIPDIPNLKILPCGPRPPNPAELLNTPKVGALVAWAGAAFDRVLIDCAPMFPVHDTLLWGRQVPAAIFLVRYGKTRVPLVAKACERLSGTGVKVLGIVVNAAKPGGLAYAPYGYHYDYYYRHYYTEIPAAKPT